MSEQTYHSIGAEVPGYAAEGNTWNDERPFPDAVGTLRFEFEGWLGDDLVTSENFWLVTPRLAAALEASDLTGYELADVIVTLSDQFQVWPPTLEFPDGWRRLISTGTTQAGTDIALEAHTDLLVSDAALALLRQHTLEQADVGDDEEPVLSEVMQRFLAMHPDAGKAGSATKEGDE